MTPVLNFLRMAVLHGAAEIKEQAVAMLIVTVRLVGKCAEAEDL
jgi:hypothetical protein